MPDRYTPFTVRPQDGGALMVGTSSEIPGIQNYTTKRDFRRVLDKEKRREGHDYFIPNLDISVGGQPFPGMLAVTSITRSSTTATVTIANGHHYEVGESIKIAGATQSQYNGTFTITAVTDTTFTYTVSGSPATPATGTIQANPVETINLNCMVRRPNGQIAVVAGSPRRLYRYFALENGAYWDSEYVANADTYVQTTTGEWIVIGYGFSTSGHRWEWVNINGYLALNNGVDLPMTYRVEETEVVPMYELREANVAAVGTISEINGILLLADISQIKEEAFTDLMASLDSYVSEEFEVSSITRSSTTATVTTEEDHGFTTGDRVLIAGADQSAYNGFKTITVTTDTAFTYSVSGSPTTPATGTITARSVITATQTGSTYSGSITGTQAESDDEVVASSAIFSSGMVGKTLRFINGWSGEITAFTDSTHVTIDSTTTDDTQETAMPFYIVDESTDFTVTASDDFFTADMVGRTIYFADTQKKIVSYVSATEITVDSDLSVAECVFEVENPESYARFTDQTSIDRIQYRVILARPDEPRRFGASFPGSMTTGQFTLELDYPVKSLEPGDVVLVQGAGVLGGNLTATVIYVYGNSVMLNTAASTTVTGATVEYLDSVGTIAGFEYDLEDDSSAILRMLELKGYIVIYKDTAIFLGQYTGSSTDPFRFTQVYAGSKTPYYRWTLIAVNGEYHIFAGRNFFYSFEVTTQKPKEIPVAELCQKLFYDQATVANMELIFSADNALTGEVFVMFPSSTSDKGLCYDYINGTIGSTSVDITAAATVKKPVTGNAVGALEDWFVMGNSSGVMMQYGRAHLSQTRWSNVKEIFYRFESFPYTTSKTAYSSVLTGGMANFGDEFNEKTIAGYLPHMASQSPTSTLSFTLSGVRNVAETATTLLSTTIPANTKNLVPMYFMAIHFQDQLSITGTDNPCEIAGRTFHVSGINSQSIIRKP